MSELIVIHLWDRQNPGEGGKETGDGTKGCLFICLFLNFTALVYLRTPTLWSEGGSTAGVTSFAGISTRSGSSSDGSVLGVLLAKGGNARGIIQKNDQLPSDVRSVRNETRTRE